LASMTYLTSLHRYKARPYIEYRRVQETSDEAADNEYQVGP
jgi:hypothetical protein